MKEELSIGDTVEYQHRVYEVLRISNSGTVDIGNGRIFLKNVKYKEINRLEDLKPIST